jgi:myosin light chain 6
MGEKQEVFNLFDDQGDGKIDATQIGTVARALGLKPTQAQVTKAAGAEYKKTGEKRLSLEEFLPIYEQLQKEKEVGTFADFMEGLRVFDKDECGKILVPELRHALLALGERLTVEEADEIVSGIEDAEGMVNYESFIKKVMAGPFPDDAE